MITGNRGFIVQQGIFLRIDNAFIEEVFYFNRNTGYLIISYAEQNQNGFPSIELLRLNVENNTIIINSFGMPMCFCDIRKGMWINVIFSPITTRSIPPQSNAFIISVQRENPPSANTTTGYIIRVDINDSSLYVTPLNNTNNPTKFVITKSTIIRNQNGIPIRIQSLRPGQIVRVTHANFQTASIPPQTTAFDVQLL